MSDNSIVIVSAKRTALGSFLGQFVSLPAWSLASDAIRGCLDHVALSPDGLSQVYLGCVLSAGQGQAPARQAMLCAGVPNHVGAVTVNKVCGSGMQALIMASEHVTLNSDAVVVAGGMESMSQAPFLMPKMRQGHKFGHAQCLDHMQLDGLEDAYQHQLMGQFAENAATHYGIDRNAQDEFAAVSLIKAQTAQNTQVFEHEIAPVEVKGRAITIDERPTQVKAEKIPSLKPAFKPDGTVTAANASAISDGAAALVLMTHAKAKALGLQPLAFVRGYGHFAAEPEWFTSAPVGAMQALQNKTGWAWDDVDLFEINEAFAVVPIIAMRELNLPSNKVNVHGGACALGHPIGASGARIVVTLLHALKTRGCKKGVASVCIGGGEATALAIEVI